MGGEGTNILGFVLFFFFKAEGISHIRSGRATNIEILKTENSSFIKHLVPALLFADIITI